MKSHLDTDVLQRGFRDANERAAALYHVNDACASCLAALDAVSLPLQVWTRETLDPVVLALRHYVELRSPHRFESILWLRAAHGYWLEHIGDEPLAFSRVVLEESRQLRTDQDDLPSKTTVSYLPDEQCRQIHRERWHDVCTLAMAYFADDLRVEGRTIEAARELRRARREVARGTGDTEVLATLLELEADLALKDDRPWKALHNIRQASETLDATPVAGRRAETLVRHGLIHLELKDYLPSVPFFEQALSESATDLPARLRAFHYLTFAKVQTRAFGEALERLEEADPLYTGRAPERLRIERLVMQGVSLLGSADRRQAERPLWEAFHLLRARDHLWLDAGVVLTDLAQLYVLAGGQDGLARVRQEYERVVAGRQPVLGREILRRRRLNTRMRRLLGGQR